MQELPHLVDHAFKSLEVIHLLRSGEVLDCVGFCRVSTHRVAANNVLKKLDEGF